MSETLELTRQQWLAERKKGIGASDAPAVLGISPWHTPLSLYLDKTNQLPEMEDKERPWQRWGLLLEEIVAREYQKEAGVELQKGPPTMKHADWPIMMASLDYWVPGERVTDIKCVFNYTSSGFGEEGSDEMPEHYKIQLQQQMAVANVEQADLVALFLGSFKVKSFHLQRNDEVISRLMDAERDFWGRVVSEDPPLPDFQHPSTAEILAMLEPVAGSVAILDNATAVLASEYQQLGQIEREAKKEREKLKARLLYALGDAEQGDLPDGRTIVRQKIYRRGYSVQPCEYQKLQIKRT